MDNIPKNEREEYALTYEEFMYIKGFVDYWKLMGNGDFKRFDSFEETKRNYTLWTLNFLKKKYPGTKFKELEYRPEVLKVYEDKGIKAEYDTVAFKFKPNRPELYLLVQDIPIFLDEFKYDAYDKGPFIRPDWSK